jgi:hypothetical protein
MTNFQKLKKIVKIIWIIAVIIFLMLLLLIGLINGLFGQKASIFMDKARYNLDIKKYNKANPENLPSTEITVDLEQGADFVLNNITNDKWFHDEKSDYNNERVGGLDDKLRLCLATMPSHTVEYFKINIIHKDINFTINNTGMIRICFYDESYVLIPETTSEKFIVSIANRRVDISPEKNAQRVKGVSSIYINTNNPPYMMNEKAEQISDSDYESRLKKNQQLTKMLDDKLERATDMAEKRIAGMREFWGDNYIDCKAWKIGDFYVYLDFKRMSSAPEDSNKYSNRIYVIRSAESEDKLLQEWLSKEASNHPTPKATNGN